MCPDPVKSQGGFTLIELIVVMVLVGIISGIALQLIMPHLSNYLIMRQRAQLVDKADLALRMIGRDVHGALPNSIRIKTLAGVNPGVQIEMLEVQSAGVYRAKLDPAVNGGANNTFCGADLDTLDFNKSEDLCFTSLAWNGQVDNPVKATDYPQPNDWVVIYNMGDRDPNYNAYVTPLSTSAVNRKTISALQASQVASTTSEFPLHLSTTGQRWAAESPQQRYQVVRYAVSYIWSSSLRILTRYQYPVSDLPQQLISLGNYPPTSITTGAGGTWPMTGGVSSLVADDVTGCSFIYDNGTSPGVAATNSANSSLGSLYLSLQISEPDAANNSVADATVTLTHVLHVGTVP